MARLGRNKSAIDKQFIRLSSPKIGRVAHLLFSEKFWQQLLSPINNFFRQISRYSKMFTFQNAGVAHDPFTIRIAEKTCDDLLRFRRLLVKGTNSVNSLEFYSAGVVDAKLCLEEIFLSRCSLCL